MMLYVVTATSTIDYFKDSGSSTETKKAFSYEEAVSYAVEFYLDQAWSSDLFEQIAGDEEGEECIAEFQVILNTYKDDFDQLMYRLYEFFNSYANYFFTGEYVPYTFEVDIEEYNDLEIEEVDKDSIIQKAFRFISPLTK